MDLSVAYNMPESTLRSLEFEYMNEIAAYMLHALAESQSMGKLLFAFRNVRNMEKFLEENAAPPGGRQPLLTRETMAYAISLSVSCVCLHSNNEILKGRASAAYERAMSDLEQMPLFSQGQFEVVPEAGGAPAETTSPTLELERLPDTDRA
jgi:hypothetical protein